MSAYDDIPGAGEPRRRSAYEDLPTEGAPAATARAAQVDVPEPEATPSPGVGFMDRVRKIANDIIGEATKTERLPGQTLFQNPREVSGKIIPARPIVELPVPRPAPQSRFAEPTPIAEVGPDRTLATVGGGSRLEAIKAIPRIAGNTVVQQLAGLGRIAGEAGADLGIEAGSTLAERARNLARRAEAAQSVAMAPFEETNIPSRGGKPPERIAEDFARWLTSPENIAQVGQQAPQLAGVAASLAGAPAGATLLATIGMPVTGQSFHQYMEKGYDAPVALLGALGQATTEVVPEAAWIKFTRRVKLGDLAQIKSMPPADQRAAITGLLKGYGIISASELGQEEVSTIGNWVVDAAMQDPNATLSDLKDQLIDTARQVAVFAPAMAGAAHVGQIAQRRAMETKTGRAATLAEELQRAVDSTDLSGGTAPIVSRETSATAAPPQDLAAAVRAEIERPSREAAATRQLAEDAAVAGGPENRYDSAIAQHIANLVGETKTPLPQVNVENIPDAFEAARLRRGEPPFVEDRELDTMGQALYGSATRGQSLEESRLTRTLNRDANTGAPSNERTVLQAENGAPSLVVGRLTRRDWLNRAERNLPGKEFDQARKWYDEIHDVLEPIFKENTPNVLRAWLLSQQRARPSQGMMNVFRALDRMRGLPGKQAGLNEKALISALRGIKDDKEGMGAKLADFIDSAMGEKARTVVGKDERGGQPAAIDVHAYRDTGFIDSPLMNYIKATYPKQAAKLKEDLSLGKEPSYEYGVRFYNDLAEWLNKINYRGGGWTAPQAQAVGWMAMQKQIGLEPETSKDIVEKNTRRVSLGLSTGQGAPRTGAFGEEEAAPKIQSIAKLAGVNILSMDAGTGAYLGDTELSFQIDALASPEAVKDFMDALGYAFQQSSVIAHRALKTGKQHAFEVLGVPAERANDFFQAMRQHSDLAVGFQPSPDGIKLLNFGGHWSERQILALNEAASLAADELGVPATGTRDYNVELLESSNDWTKNPDGKAYTASLRKRGRVQAAEQLEREHAPVGLDQLGQGVRDQQDGKSPAAAIATAGAAKAHELANPPKKTRLGKCHQLTWRKVNATLASEQPLTQVIGLVYGMRYSHEGGEHLKIWHSVARDPVTGNFWEPISDRWFTPQAMKAYGFAPVKELSAKETTQIAVKAGYYTDQVVLKLRGRDQNLLANEDVDVDWSIIKPPQQLKGEGVRSTDERDIVNNISREMSPEDKAAALAQLTEQNKPLVAKFIETVDSRTGAVSMANVKKPENILSKASRPEIKARKPWFDVEHVRDSFRFKSVLQDIRQLPEIGKLLSSWGWEPVKVDVAKVLAPEKWGWRIAAVDLRLPNGQLVEYYAPVAELEQAKERVGHSLFEKWRNRDLTQLDQRETDEMQRDMVTSRRLYERAWRAYLRRTDQSESDVAEALSNFSRVLESGSPISSISEAENATPSRQAPSTSERAGLPEEKTTAREPSPEQKTETMAASLAGEGARRDGFSGKVTERRATPATVGMKTGIRTPPSVPAHLISTIPSDQAAVVAGALADLQKVGMSQWLPASVPYWVTFGPRATSNEAMYFPKDEAIGIQGGLLVAANNGHEPTLRALRGYLAHELAHQLDSTGPEHQELFDFDSFSRRSHRLAYDVEDGIINPRGDLITEAADLYYGNTPKWLQNHLAYPLAGVMQYDAGTVKSEVFAQMHTLYFTANRELHRYAPKWYALFEGIYGEEDQAQSLTEARGRLRDALQASGARQRAQEGRVRGEDRAGAGAGLPGEGVGRRAGSSQRPTGGAAQPPAANRHGTPAGGINWSADQPGVGDALARAFQNNQIDLKAVQDAIREAGGIIQSATDPYLTDELVKSRYSERIKRFDNDKVKPLLRAIQKAGLTAEDVGNYLWARHAPEANAKLAQLNPGLPDASGMSDAEAQRVIGQFRAAGKLQDLQAIAAQVDAMINATRQLYVQEGLESQKTVNDWAATYKHYVPLHREIENPAPGPGRGFKIVGPETKRRLGSQRPAVAILAAVIAKHHNAIIRAEKARVGRDLIKLAEAFPNPDFWRVDQPPLQRYVNPSSGLVEMRIDPQYKQREDVFVVKEKNANGDIVERVLAFNPHNERAIRLSHAMQKLDVAEMGAVTKIVGKATRFLANLATQWNPVFWSTNLARDVQTMAVNLQSTPLKGKAPRVMVRMPAAMAGIADATWGPGNSKYAKMWKEFAAAGGPTGFYRHFENIVERQEDVEKMVRQMGQGKGDPRVWGRWAAEQISNVNAVIENSTRLAVYTMAREQGLTERQSASIAKNITVNFDRRGNMSLATNAWYMFFNANVQGTARLYQALKSPRVQATVGVLTALGAAMAIINMLIGDRDKDEYGNNPYELIPEWEKQRNWIFMLPKSSDKGDPIKNDKGEIIGRYVKLPLPYGFNVFPSIGRIAVEAALTAARSPWITEKRTPVEMAGDLGNVVVDSFSPLGQTATPIQTIAPTIADPFVQVWENKKFTGNAMVPDRTQYNQQVPRSQLYFNSNSEIAKDTAAMLNRATGGDDLTPGKLDIYPGHIEHVFSTLTGGPGTFAMGWLDWGTNVTRRALGHEVEPTRTSRIPFVGKFYGEVDERAVEAKFYRIKKKADEEYGRYRALRKAGEIEAADKIEAENPALIDFAREVAKSTFRKEQKELRNEMRGTRDLPIMDRGQAKDQIRRDQSQLYQRALEAYNAAAKGDQ